MSRKRKQITLSDDDEDEPGAAIQHRGLLNTSPQDAKKGAKPTKSTKRTLQVTSSQEERRGALSLQLSQASDQPKKVQSLLRFKPVKRTEEASTEPQQQSETAADTVRHRGYGSQPDPAELPRGQGQQGGWLVRHAPQTVADLVMHKKKVDEIRGWLELQLQPGLHCKAPKVLVLTGPAGCCKSTAVQLLAKAMGFDLCEWQPPVPTLWNEHRYHLTDGSVPYVSKLEEFETFVAHSKLATLSLRPTLAVQQPESSSLPSQASGNPVKPAPKLVMLDDLPHASSAEQRGRLAAALSQLAASARSPVVIISTTSSTQGRGEAGGFGGGRNASGGGAWHGLHKDIQAALDSVGVAQISCNPITDNNAAKALQRIAQAEAMPLSKEQALGIAASAAGDLRQAVETLELLCVGQQPLKPAPKMKRKATGGAKGEAEPSLQATQMATDRDIALDPFHAIGKLLNNKRSKPGSEASSQHVQENSVWSLLPDGSPSLLVDVTEECSQNPKGSPVQLAERHTRAPLSFNPEKVWQQSGLDVATTAGFLHENALHFIDHDYIEDAAAMMGYFSDVDRVASHSYASSSSSGGYAEDLGAAGSFAEAAAGSLLARGVLHANGHPAPRRWLPLRKSAWGTAQGGQAANLQHLQSLIWAGGGASSSASGSARTYAAGLLPFLRCMAASRSKAAAAMLPAVWVQLWEGQLIEHKRSLDIMPVNCGMGDLEVGEVIDEDDDAIELT